MTVLQRSCSLPMGKVVAHRIVALTITGLRTGAIEVDEISGEVNVNDNFCTRFENAIDRLGYMPWAAYLRRS